jgi:glucosyl-dolichyl phosphate glucuronosyltransferase
MGPTTARDRRGASPLCTSVTVMLAVGNRGCGLRAAEQSVSSDPLREGATVTVTVVVCAYTETRWAETRAALASVLSQSPRPEQVILVVDYNPGLAARARAELSSVTVLENDEAKGLSGARNTGLRNATQPVTVFLDDDAEARPGWLACLVEPYRSPDVVATGGSVHPDWPDHRPRWLPPTFDWVIGCSYLGMPETEAAIRNPIGANMSMRTQLALAVGAFNSRVGRVGRHPRGCEETEFSIRLTAAQPSSVINYVPAAAVDHHISSDRLTARYFLRRCWHEGQSKADVVQLTTASAGLRLERRQAAAVIPAAIFRDVRAAAKGEAVAVARIAAAVAGLAMATAGYLAGRIRW